MLKKLFNDLKNNKGVILETSSVAIVLHREATFVIEADENTSGWKVNVSGSEWGGIELLPEMALNAGNWRDILQAVRPDCSTYPYDKIAKELQEEIKRRKVTMVYRQLRNEYLEKAITISAALEAFTEERIEDDLSEKINVVYTNRGTSYEKARYNVSDDKVKAFKTEKLSIREAINNEKRYLNKTTKGFEVLLLFWSDFHQVKKLPKVLFQKVDDHNRPELWRGLPFYDLDKKQLIVSLKTKAKKLTGYDFVAMETLAGLCRQTGSRDFWVTKWNASPDVIKLAKDEGLELIDTDRLRELFKHQNPTTDQLKAIKRAIFNCSDLYLHIKTTTTDGSECSMKPPLAVAWIPRTQTLKNRQTHYDSLMSLNPHLFKVKSKEYFLRGSALFFPIIKHMKAQEVPPACRLMSHLVAYLHTQVDKEQVRIMSLRDAAHLVGYGDLFESRKRSEAKKIVKHYLDGLVRSGVIVSWELQTNGAYKIIIGL